MKDSRIQQIMRFVSIGLVAAGAVLFGLTLLGGSAANLAQPLLIVVLGAAFILLVFLLANVWAGAPWLYLPGCVLIALGLILFIDAATGDWNSWSYAWTLLVAGLGVGVLLLGRQPGFSRLVSLIGLGMAAAGVTLFVLFGMLVGGMFIQIIAPVLLVAIGVALWRLRIDTLLLNPPKPAGAIPAGEAASPDQNGLPEPLSAREIEVLRLIDQGLTNAVIAERLVLAPSTVKTHINNIYSKLGVQSRVQALQRAKELGLLER